MSSVNNNVNNYKDNLVVNKIRVTLLILKVKLILR